jgi:bifunctional DNase/RNase
MKIYWENFLRDKEKRKKSRQRTLDHDLNLNTMKEEKKWLSKFSVYGAFLATFISRLTESPEVKAVEEFWVE